MNIDSQTIRRELIIALATLLVSCLAVPTLIFAVGRRLFGAYAVSNGISAGLPAFYRALFNDLGHLQWAAWSIVIGPLVIVSLLRWVLAAPTLKPASEPHEVPPSPRREPTVDA